MTFKLIEKQLFDACKEGDLKKVKSLYKKGVDIHIEKCLAFRLASYKGHLDIVKFLLKKGADIHAYEDNALCESAEGGHLNIVKFLIENGANIYAKNSYALHLSLKYNHSEVTYYLFSLYEDKEQAFDIVLERLSYDNLSAMKKIIDQYDGKINNRTLQEVKKRVPNAYDYIKISKEITSIQNNIDFDIR